MKPLTKDKEILEMKEGFPKFTSFAQAYGNAGRKVKRPSGKSLFYGSDIAQALELLKEKLRKLPNRDDWIQEGNSIHKGILDGGGVGYVEVKDLIDTCFPVFKEK